MDEKRINWIDWAKVLGLFLVVYAHVPGAEGGGHNFSIPYALLFYA